MKVYVLLEGERGEGAGFVSVYATRDGARAALRAMAVSPTRAFAQTPVTWDGDDKFTVQCDYAEIVEQEVLA